VVLRTVAPLSLIPISSRHLGTMAKVSGCWRYKGSADVMGGEGIMIRASMTVLLGVLAFAVWGQQPAAADCQMISATHSAHSRLEALRSSQALAVESANDLKRAKGWKYFTMRAYRVQPNPFWKTVRPVVPENVMLKPDVVTPVTYTTCFTGVVVPYVCTSGSAVCGN